MYIQPFVTSNLPYHYYHIIIRKTSLQTTTTLIYYVRIISAEIFESTHSSLDSTYSYIDVIDLSTQLGTYQVTLPIKIVFAPIKAYNKTVISDIVG